MVTQRIVDLSVYMKFMSFLETKYKVYIHVIGDHPYTSGNKSNQAMHIQLMDGHYSMVKDNNKTASLLNHIPKKPQQLVICEVGKHEATCFDGETQFTLELEECYSRRNDLFGEFAYTHNIFNKSITGWKRNTAGFRHKWGN